MKWTDPAIRLVSCGQQGWNDWDRIVIEGLADLVDFHSIHIYTGSDDYYTNVFHPHQADRALRICEAVIERVRYAQRIDHPIYIAYDEWNVWYRERSPEARRAGLEERYNLADAIAVATFLNIFIRHCRSVRIANLAQMVNVIAPIVTSPQGIFLQTIYHPFRLYAEHTREIALDVGVACETYAFPAEGEEVSERPHRVADLGPFALLDAAATCDVEGREICLAVVNRDRDRSLAAAIRVLDGAIGSPVRAYEVWGEDPGAANSFERPKAVDVRERRVEDRNGSGLRHAFPPHSVTVMRIPVG